MSSVLGVRGWAGHWPSHPPGPLSPESRGRGRGRRGESMTKVKISSYTQYLSGQTQNRTEISGPSLHTYNEEEII